MKMFMLISQLPDDTLARWLNAQKRIKKPKEETGHNRNIKKSLKQLPLLEAKSKSTPLATGILLPFLC
jgi:hypothetical protein